MKLLSILEQYMPRNIRRSIKSVPVQKLRELEVIARGTGFAPFHSLSNYWRLDYRSFKGSLDKVVELFNGLAEVGLAYKEMPVSDPAINPTDDIFLFDRDTWMLHP
ncbi:hypothetical protein [Paraflavitalea speifideaquila]|uniref:hypothetical protein n=1 Tax=Paraflavitalea speifideaquila TaxID=3076558 RepID=UPI0028E5A86B|nr:hypothetical protein [Paraflavitalea speifideiaquila]